MWDVLAIAPTDDPKVIRRAYAARLKQIDPDRDRETFALLRQALEWALARAKQRPSGGLSADAATLPPDGDDDGVAPVGTRASRRSVRLPPAPTTDVAEESLSESALLIALETALQGGDARDSWQLYVRAAASGAVPLGDNERMLARLFTAALDDPSVDGATFCDLARKFGWNRASLGSPAFADVHHRVASRLAAEEWFTELVVTAESRKAGIRPDQVRAARLLLRGIAGWDRVVIELPTLNALRAFLTELRPHQVWLHDRIPPGWAETLEQRLRQHEKLAGVVVIGLTASLLLLAIGALFVSARTEGLSLFTGVAFCFAVCLSWMLWRSVRGVSALWRKRAA
jgi:hypothetical protein